MERLYTATKVNQILFVKQLASVAINSIKHRPSDDPQSRIRCMQSMFVTNHQTSNERIQFIKSLTNFTLNLNRRKCLHDKPFLSNPKVQVFERRH